MTLKQYLSNLQVKISKYKNNYTETFLINQINEMRQTLAFETRCLECTNIANSKANQAAYTLPDDCIEVFEVWYDGDLLIRKTSYHMDEFRDGTISSGTPIYWAVYGGVNQAIGYAYLYPTPNTDNKEIKLVTLQLPTKLTSLNQTCDLPQTIQKLVVEGVAIELAWNEPRTDPRLPIRYQIWQKRVNDNKNLRVL